MSSNSNDPRIRQAGQERRRQTFDAEFTTEPRRTTGKRSLQERLLGLCARVSEEMLTGAVVGVIAGTPCLRRLFVRVLMTTAAASALLMLLLVLLVISLVH